MLLAGMALPPIQLGGMGIIAVAAHVVLLTIVSNIGKCLAHGGLQERNDLA